MMSGSDHGAIVLQGRSIAPAPCRGRRDRDQDVPAYTIVAGNPARTINGGSLNDCRRLAELHVGLGARTLRCALPDFRKLAVEDFSKISSGHPPRSPISPATKCNIVTDIIHRGGRTLLGEDMLETSLQIADGEIAAVGSNHGRGSLGLDASGLRCCRAFVDLHAYAFERQMMPRPGVDFPVDVALVDSDRQAIANASPRFFHAQTCPGAGPAWRRQCAGPARGYRKAEPQLGGGYPFHLRPRDLQSRCEAEISHGCPMGASICSRSMTTWIQRSPVLPSRRSAAAW